MGGPTDHKVRPIDVRTLILEEISNSPEGISRQSLSRYIHCLLQHRSPSNYKELFCDFKAQLDILVAGNKISVYRQRFGKRMVIVYALNSCKLRSVTEEEDAKECTKCGTVKAIEKFRKRSDANDGHYSQCRDCENAGRKAKGWNRYSVRIRQKCDPEKNPVIPFPTLIEIDAAVKERRAQLIEEYQKRHGRPRYIEVDGRSVSAPGREVSPVEEYNRAWKRIRTKQVK